MAVAFTPASSFRLKPHLALRFLSLLPIKSSPPLSNPPKTLTFHPRLSLLLSPLLQPLPRWRYFFAPITAALPLASEKPNPPETVDSGGKVGEFRKRLMISDIKGGSNEGLDRVGERLVVRGWVRTLRMQSSVTFIEVNDGSCLSNMQCVVGSDAEGYDQVEAGFISTGALIWVQGIVVSSPGAKQKVELKVDKIVTVGKSDSSFPIQKKGVSREFLRSKAHLRPNQCFWCGSKGEECFSICYT